MKTIIKCVIFDLLGVLYPDNLQVGEALIVKLKKQGIEIAVITSLNRQAAEEICERLKIDKLTVAGELKMKKSDPRVYKKFLTANDLDAAEVIFIDDHVDNLLAAKKNGITTVLYDGDDNGADFNVESWSELEQLIERLCLKNH